MGVLRSSPVVVAPADEVPRSVGVEESLFNFVFFSPIPSFYHSIPLKIKCQSQPDFGNNERRNSEKRLGVELCKQPGRFGMFFDGELADGGGCEGDEVDSTLRD